MENWQLVIRLILTTMMITQYKTQEIHLQDLNNNNGYITLHMGNERIIKSYNKVLHIINTTEISLTKDHIKDNVLNLKPKSEIIGPMYNTLNQSLTLLEAKIENMKPHYRQRRGLIDILGTGLKYIAGTMDHSDEIEIKGKLDELLDGKIENSRKKTTSKSL